MYTLFLVLLSTCKGCSSILGQVWYLIVLIPDLCTFTYFKKVRSAIKIVLLF